MEIGAVVQAAALDALVVVRVEASSADAGGAAAPSTLTTPQGLRASLGLEPPNERPVAVDAAPESTATLPDPADLGPQAAAAQTLGRPHAPVLEPLRPADSELPHATHAGSEFALPADQLLPVTLTGLQVEAAAAWPLLHRSGTPGVVPDRADAQQRGRHDAQSDHDDAAPPADETVPDTTADATWPERPAFEPQDERDWCDTLTAAFAAALATATPPRALLAAAEQWQRGRCIVFACPQGRQPDGAAWAFVLWPRRRQRAGARLALCGLRVEARLRWTTPPRGLLWRHGRVVKEHHPRHGRQLVPLDTGSQGGGVPCEVQLGPVLARPLRRCEVCLRVDLVYRFWSALGAQWSACIVVCSQPLAGERVQVVVEDAKC